MTRKISRKPKTPEQIAADKLKARQAQFAAVNLNPESAMLESHADIEAETDQRATTGNRGNAARASRMDGFDALRAGMVQGAYDAARRLEKDILTAAGLHDRGRATVRVDNDEGKDRTDDMVDASARVVFVFARIGRLNATLLEELIAPTPITRLCGPHWRNVVALVMRESNAHAQCAVLRAACANLVPAYKDWEAEERRRAALKAA